MEHQNIMDRIHAMYALRKAGDGEGTIDFFAPDATFELAGSANLLPALPVERTAAQAAVLKLIAMFEFRELEELDAVVEGNKAAIRWRLVVAYGEQVRETQLFDLWTFGDDGKATSLIQFTDTALLVGMM